MKIGFLGKVFLNLAFLPPLWVPVGLYMAGDKNVLGFKLPNGTTSEFFIPDSSTGNRFTLTNDVHTKFFIYVNKNEEAFNLKMNPPANELAKETIKLSRLDEEKLIMVFYSLIKTKCPQRKYKLKDANILLQLIDDAIQIKHGLNRVNTIPANKWEKTKEEVAEAKITKTVIPPSLKSSVSPLIIDDSDLSDVE